MPEDINQREIEFQFNRYEVEGMKDEEVQWVVERTMEIYNVAATVINTYLLEPYNKAYASRKDEDQDVYVGNYQVMTELLYDAISRCLGINPETKRIFILEDVFIKEEKDGTYSGGIRGYVEDYPMTPE